SVTELLRATLLRGGAAAAASLAARVDLAAVRAGSAVLAAAHSVVAALAAGGSVLSEWYNNCNGKPATVLF
ncbi:MAG: hypothetical protein JNK33_02680, partial [Candidatus Doudnabacteria bacterium]|nr:hypothetical protein [Candidatus Doudnabacteria bacterium]